MLRLTSSALARSHEFLLSIHSTHNLAELRTRISAGLPQLVACDRASFNEASMNADRTTVRPTPLPDWWNKLGEIYEQHATDHPCLNPRRPPPLLKTVSFSDPPYAAAWRKSVLRHEYFKPLGVEHQLSAVCHRESASLVALALNRQRRHFSAEDRRIMDLTNPHIAQAWRNALAVTALHNRPADDDTGREPAVVAVSSRCGTLRTLSPDAARLLRRYFSTDHCGRARLPEPLDAWLRVQRAQLSDPASAAFLSAPFVVRRSGGRLTVRMVQARPDESLLLFEHLPDAGPVPDNSIAGLSPRENEVLRWLGEGKRNAEIAIILAISPRTVEKHVERILGKLGVENRAAAISHAFTLRTPNA